MLGVEVLALHEPFTQCSERWVPPYRLHPAEFNKTIAQALVMIAEDLYDQLSPTVAQLLGTETWWDGLEARNGLFRRLDIASWHDMFKGGSAIDPAAQDAFREAWKQVFFGPHPQRTLRGPVWIRHALAHPDEHLGVELTREYLAALYGCANTLQLRCTADLARLATEFERLVDGGELVPLTREEIEEQNRRLKIAGDEAAKLAARLEQLEIAHAEDSDRLGQIGQDRDAAAEREREAKARVAELEKLVSDTAASEAQAVDAKEALHEAKLELEDNRRRRQEAERERDRARAAAESAARALEEAEEEKRAADDRAQKAVNELRLAAATRPPVAQRMSPEIDELLRCAAQLPSTDTTASVGESGLPAAGQPWPYERGQETWTLRTDRTMARRDDDASLADIIGAGRARGVVESFLAIRPSGGRVWVDEDGDACTYIGGHLLYLGRIFDHPAPSVGDPPVGTVIDVPAGRRYRITRSGVETAAGETLATVIGPHRARAIASRLREARPSGGRYRVDSSGLAATFVDGHWVYAGRVRADEWFPGHID